MSLKAKIEAVIYASEEPVTLAQLVGLLGVEAQAELDRASSAQQTLALDEAGVEAEEAELVAEEPTLGLDLEQEAAGQPSSESGEPTSQDMDQDMDRDMGDPGEGPSQNPEMRHPADEEAPEVVAEPVDSSAEEAAAAAAVAARAEKARATRLRAFFRSALDGLIAEYSSEDRGLEIREIAGGFRFATKPEYHDAVRGFVKSLKPPLKLTLQSLETLAVVAYKQPVTSPEISEIRGVDSSGVLGSLIARKLITTAGRKQVIGRPILYKTTKEFLLKFGLRDVAELPSIEEFEKMAGQMAEQEEIAMEHEVSEMPADTEARLESDGEAEPAEPVADEVIVDGRVSGLVPQYDDAQEDDPSAREAEIQRGE